MKKLFGFLAGLIVLLAAAVVVGPNVVNWNDYKGEIAQQVRDLTGRELTINGDIRIAVLPAPALVASDIALANPDGASARNMATLKSVEVRVALGPLLGGKVKIETVTLIDPVVNLERLPDGSANWEFAPADSAKNGAKPAPAGVPAEAGGTAPPPIALDNLTVANGTLVYRDAVTGTTERITGLNTRIAAASLKGPLETKGSATVRGIPLSFDVNIGEIIHGRTVPVSLQLGSAAAKLTVQATGTVLDLEENPRFKGQMKVEGGDLASLLGQLGGSAPAGIAGRPVGFEGDLTASAKDVEIKNLNVTLGDVRAGGDLRVEIGTKLRVGSRIEIKKLDADALIDGAAGPAAAAGAPKPGQADAKKSGAGTPAKPAEAAGPLRFELPKNVEGSLILSVDAIAYRDGVIRDVLVNADINDGAVTVSQASAQFPGGSDFAVAATLTTPGGVPTVGGELETTVSDMRGVLSWLDVELPAIPRDRLRKFSLQSSFAGTPDQVQATGLDLRFDSSRLTGGVTVALRKRLAFGADLVLDRFNLDAYLPSTKPAAKPKPAAATSPAAGAAKKGAKPSDEQAAAQAFAALSGLTRFDANLKTHVKTLVYQGTQIKDLVSDVTLHNGNLDIRRLSVARLAGASAKLKGKLKRLGQVPTADNLSFEFSARNVAGLARLAGVSLPVDAKKIGAVNVKGTANGSLLRPTLKATANVAGATLGINGRVSALPISDLIDANLTLRHKDPVKLLRRFGVDYRPSGRLGGLDLAADVKASAAKAAVSNLRAQLGKLTLRGKIDAVLGGARPKVVADLAAGAIAIDPLLPAKRGAALDGVLLKIDPAAWRPAPAGGQPSIARPVAAKRGQWSTERLDLSALNAVDAELALTSPLIIFGKYLFEKANIAATVKDGVLSTQRLTGLFFGGQVKGGLGASAGPRPRIEAVAEISGVDVARTLESVTGEATANGRMALNFNVDGSGRSVAELVGALGGNGSVALTDVDVRKAGKGSLLSGFMNLMTSLGRLGGGNANDRAEMTATFTMNRGVARTNDVKLASAYGNGVAAGTVDLPAWTIDMQGEVELAQNLLTKILRAKVRESRQAVPFAIKGALDAPNVKVDTGALLGAGVPIPGADALLNKAPKGVQNILKGILGGATGQQPPSQPSSPPPASSGGQPPPANTPPPPPTQQNQQELNPEKLLKQLFKL
ncbi:MAG: AsmA family protein [Magnetovibrio sp.]|nr:AsmA family protein [Magnetovibrio sp.]